jgi:multidrug efflux pump subunit AcrA (membrane-fusion protein)
VIFEPTAVRIAAVHPQIGAPVSAGDAVLDVTSTTPIVEVALPVGQSYLVKVGDSVTATLPDRTTSDGTISAVGTVATTAADANGASGPSAATPPAATISVRVALTKTGGAASLDQAPVTVNITSTTVTDVLAVPTTALVALAGGGYALEVVDRDGTHRLLPITAGIFDDQSGLVEVSGDGLNAGQKVVAPA